MVIFNVRFQQLATVVGSIRIVRSTAQSRLLLTTALLAMLLGVMPGRAVYASTNYVVNSIADTDDGTCDITNCTLWEAINAANANAGPDTISFSVSGTIVLTETLPAINDDVTIIGTGHAITVSGNNAVRVMNVNTGKTLNLQSITIANGVGVTCGSGTCGGGISNLGKLTLINSTLSGNNANYGGGIMNLDGTLTVTQSTVTGNNATSGGAIENYYGTMVVTNSTFLSNTAGAGGGIDNLGKLAVSDSTFLTNTASSGGGGIYNDSVGTLDVTNSTFSGNSGGNGGGINNNGGTVTAINSTLSGNSSAYGGGIINFGTLNLTNTIIANNPGNSDCYASGGSVTGSHNLIKTTAYACTLTNGTNGNLIGIDPKLGPLANNGGPTLTYAPLPGSPTINTGVNASCPAYDQRGVTRPQGGICDIGAVESLSWPRQYLPVIQR